MAMAFSVQGIFACSCFGPETFCATLDPPYEQPEWWIPDAIVLGVKVAQEAHGLDVQVIESLSGSPQEGDILRVWGDCGLLCRVYPDAWEIGDTMIWALRHTDLMGNGLCGTQLEQEGDWMISICGTYYLDYSNDVVTGPIAEGVNTLPYHDFLQFMNSCLATSLPESHLEIPVQVGIDGAQLSILIDGPIDGLEYELFEASGRLIGAAQILSDRTAIPIDALCAGAYLIRLSDGLRSRTVKVNIP